MSYGRLKAKEAKLSAEVDELIKKANQYDQEEDDAYKKSNGYTRFYSFLSLTKQEGV